jgi:subtilisin family serine protease
MRYRWRTAVVAAAVIAALLGADPVQAGSVAGPSTGQPGPGRIQGAGVPGVVKDRYIVVLKDVVLKDAVLNDAATGTPRALARRYGGAVTREYSAALRGFAVRISEARARWLAADPMVAYVQQDRRVSAAEVQQAPPSWGLDRIDRAAPALDGRYVYPSRAANITAYVIDTGIRVSHSTFGGRAGYGWDFVDDDPVADDCNGHGTHVAGTIGGSQYGVAKGVQLVAVRVLDCDGTGFYSQIIAGVDWVTEHAVKPAVANMSIGGPADSALDKAVRVSIASGVTYAVAAGN